MRFFICLLIMVAVVAACPAILSAGPSIHEYTQAIEDSPEDMKYKFYLLRGRAYKDSGNLEFALRDLNESIKLDPSRIAFQYRGEVFFEEGRFAEAIDDFTKALEINPSYDLYKLRGDAYLKSENYVLALADGLNIIDMVPRDAESYYISMDALESLGDIKLARQQAFKVISFDRGNRKANEIITKYPLKFVFIGESPVTLYISQEDGTTMDKANEIFLRYKKGENIDKNLKRKLDECSAIGVEIKEFQARLNETWDNYFEEIKALKIRSRKIHDELRTKYQQLGKEIERDIDIWEDKSNICAEELVQAFWRSE